MSNYSIGINPNTTEKTITKDGHLMFIEDVLYDIECLQQKIKKLEMDKTFQSLSGKKF